MRNILLSILFISAMNITRVSGQSTDGTPIPDYRPILEQTLTQIRQMAPGQEYDLLGKMWFNFEDEPTDEEVPPISSHFIVWSTPDEPYTQASYVRLDGDRFIFGYDGHQRIREFRDGKNGIYERDTLFQHKEAPRIRVVTKPFFQAAAQILDYVLHSPDSMQVQMWDHPDHYELYAFYCSDQIISFGCGNLDPHGYKFSEIPKSLRNGKCFNRIRIRKADMLPYQIQLPSGSRETYQETVANRHTLDIDHLTITDYLPKGYRFATKADKEALRSKNPAGIGQPLPPFTAIDTEGDTITERTYRGKVILLVHTAIGCGHCQDAKGTLAEICEQYPSEQFQILALDAWQEPLDKMRKYNQQEHLPYPFALQQDSVKLPAQLGNKTVLAPWFTLIDKEGIIRATIKGFKRDELLTKVQQMMTKQ